MDKETKAVSPEKVEKLISEVNETIKDIKATNK